MNQTYSPIEIYVVNDAPEDLLWRNCICSGSMSLIRREVFEQCGYFDERFRSRQDQDMWLRVAQKYKDLYEERPDVQNSRYAGMTKEWIARGEFKEAWQSYKKALKIKKISKYNLTQPVKGIAKYLLHR